MQELCETHEAVGRTVVVVVGGGLSGDFFQSSPS